MSKGTPRARSALPGPTARGGYRRIVALLVSLVTVPTVVLLVVGILMLVFYRANIDLVLGILVFTVVVCLTTGSVLAMVFIRREARLSELQSDFVSKVSHELRTPLTSIRIFAETLQRKKIPPEQEGACVDALARESGKLTARIERLLDWGRMEAGKRVYELRPDSVEAVAKSALEAFRGSLLGQEVNVRVEIPPDLPPILADRGALTDALVNLLSNAYKYSKEPRKITLFASTENGEVRLGVRDKGIGIPRAEHRRIFEKFYRVNERLSRQAGGTGLGLAIVWHIARGHKGYVEVESEVGKGSTFTIVLPRSEKEEPAP